MKHRKQHAADDRKKGSLIGVLMGNYLGFTLALVLVGGVLMALLNLMSVRLTEGPQYDKLLQSAALREERYAEVPAERYLGRGSYLKVVDADGALLYSGSAEDTAAYTPGELACIGESSAETYGQATDFFTETGEKRILVTTIDYRDTKGASMDNVFYVLDENYRILSASRQETRTALTKEEFGYLSGRLPESYDLRKAAFTTKAGETRVALFFCPIYTSGVYEAVLRWMDAAPYVFAVFYCVLLALFVLLLNRQVKRPLGVLHGAIREFGAGKQDARIHYTGPAEFVEICDSFDDMAQKLSQSEAQRSKLEAEKQKMLADISHDLKTPVTVMQGYARALSDGLIPPAQQKQVLATIDAKAQTLATLLHAFSEYNKLEHPDFRLHCMPCDLCEYVREYLAEKYNEFELGGFGLEVDLPDAPLQCLLDRQELRRVLENLTANTMRYNVPGTRLFVALEKHGAKAVLTLGDDGAGIDPAAAAHIFDAFVVGDTARAGVHGSGLGLAICKKLVEAHGGAIRLVLPPPAPCKTQFEITLPLCEAEQTRHI